MFIKICQKRIEDITGWSLVCHWSNSQFFLGFDGTAVGLSKLNEHKFPSALALTKEDAPTGAFEKWRQLIVKGLQSSHMEEYLKRDVEGMVAVLCLMDDAARLVTPLRTPVS